MRLRGRLGGRRGAQNTLVASRSRFGGNEKFDFEKFQELILRPKFQRRISGTKISTLRFGPFSCPELGHILKPLAEFRTLQTASKHFISKSVLPSLGLLYKKRIPNAYTVQKCIRCIRACCQENPYNSGTVYCTDLGAKGLKRARKRMYRI